MHKIKYMNTVTLADSWQVTPAEWTQLDQRIFSTLSSSSDMLYMNYQSQMQL